MRISDTQRKRHRTLNGKLPKNWSTLSSLWSLRSLLNQLWTKILVWSRHHGYFLKVACYMLWYRTRKTCRSSRRVKCIWDVANMVSLRTAEFKKSGEISQEFCRILFQDCVGHCDYFALIYIHDMNTILPSLYAWGDQPQKWNSRKKTANVLKLCIEYTCIY